MGLRISNNGVGVPLSGLPKLSLCMIVKDEESNLPRCLESVKGLADETVIVDTGSADRTKEIARQFGATVIDFPWRDDFSAARNAGLAQARGQWILFLDADEELAPGQGEPLRALLDATEYQAWYVDLINYRGSKLGGGTVTASAVRLFRNDGYRFQGVIHEQILPSIEAAGGKAGVSHIKVNHYGYLTEQMQAKDKVNRNLRILERVVADHPGDSFALYNLAMEHMKAKDYEGAFALLKESYERASDANLKEQYGSHVMREIVVCLGMLGQTKLALDFLRSAKKIHPQYTDLHYYEGLCLLDQKRFQEAEGAFRTCLLMGEPPGFYISETGVGGKMAKAGLKEALRGQQKRKRRR